MGASAFDGDKAAVPGLADEDPATVDTDRADDRVARMRDSDTPHYKETARGALTVNVIDC